MVITGFATVPRPKALERIARTFSIHPIAALLGLCQCGKTILAKLISEGKVSTYFDLENPVDARPLAAPMSNLEPLTGLIVIDETQRRPKLFELLRVLVDRPGKPGLFLILGSASPNLITGVSESPPGRVGFIDLGRQEYSLDDKITVLPIAAQSKIQNYRMTRSALASTFGGMVKPICLAAFRLMISSNLVGCSTGRSAGLAPFRILST